MGRRTKINLYCITQIDWILTCPWPSSPSCTWSRASAPPLHRSSLPTCVGIQGYGSAARRNKTRDVSCITETRFSFDSYLLSASSVAAAPVDAVCLQAVMSEQQVRSARGEPGIESSARIEEFRGKETWETRGELQLRFKGVFVRM